ncbi:MAG TPA: hypothetical protein EYG95_03375 [Campylobacterales bacterium]|nr:hypothetical protein [Campylobacterales bacterium]
MIDTKFQHIQADDDIKEVIKSAFDLELDVDGGWGYDKDSALIIHDSPMPLLQLQHTLSSMRAHLEMNMTLSKEKRYGAINVNEIKREEKEFNIRKYDIITFEISAMLEETYAKFIEEYKAGQDSDGFDIQAHFERRKKATLIRKEVFWFDISNIKS